MRTKGLQSNTGRDPRMELTLNLQGNLPPYQGITDVCYNITLSTYNKALLHMSTTIPPKGSFPRSEYTVACWSNRGSQLFLYMTLYLSLRVLLHFIVLQALCPYWFSYNCWIPVPADWYYHCIFSPLRRCQCITAAANWAKPFDHKLTFIYSKVAGRHTAVLLQWHCKFKILLLLLLLLYSCLIKSYHQWQLTTTRTSPPWWRQGGNSE